MFDLKEIQETIEQLENVPITLKNAQELACLYIIRNEHKTVENDADKRIIKEYKDILPSYTLYVDAKRRYQLGELNETVVLTQLENLCIEISEFLNILYSSTDMWKERKLIKSMLTTLEEHFE